MKVRPKLPKLNIFYPIIFILLFFLVTGVFVIVESGACWSRADPWRRTAQGASRGISYEKTFHG